MKNFKTFDVAISILLLLSFIIAGIVNVEYLMAGYFVVGGWQLISIIVHATNKWFTHRHSARYAYHALVLVIFCLGITSLLLPQVLMVLLFILIFSAPLMAVYYTWLCYHELTVKMQRPLAALK